MSWDWVDIFIPSYNDSREGLSMSIERPLPKPTEYTRPYWESAKQNKLVIQKCSSCESLQFYPRPYCISCLSDEMDWVEVSGRGTIYTYTINHRSPNSYMQDKVPYVVAIIELEEGIRMMANIIDSVLDKVEIGAHVHVVFENINEDITIPQFKII